MGGATRKRKGRGGSHGFQSTRPWGARHQYRAHACEPSCFNPRARGGRDGLTLIPTEPSPVSIHAPVGGATGRMITRKSMPRVSIHAPVGGATWPRLLSAHPLSPFQSTRPWGARQPRTCSPRNKAVVSIHAPVGGATELMVSWEDEEDVSIHAPVGGATSRNTPLKMVE